MTGISLHMQWPLTSQSHGRAVQVPKQSFDPFGAALTVANRIENTIVSYNAIIIKIDNSAVSLVHLENEKYFLLLRITL
jgi:hypothetical protein